MQPCIYVPTVCAAYTAAAGAHEPSTTPATQVEPLRPEVWQTDTLGGT